MADKKLKKPVLQTMDITSKWTPVYRLSTGVLAFDIVLGGGFPSGRIIEMYGGESSYKSLVVLQSLAEAVQDEENLVVYSDNEHSIEKGLVDMVNLDIEKLLYLDVDNMTSVKDVFDMLEAGLDKAKELGKRLIFGWDSLGASPGHEDLIKEIGRNEAGMRRAKEIKDGLNKFGPRIGRENAMLIIVNWSMDKIGVQFGDKETTPGGRSMKFWASVRMRFKSTGKIIDEKSGEQIGGKGNLLIRKNKASKPFGQVNFEHYAMQNLDKYTGLLDYYERHGVVKLSGAWYSFPGGKSFHAVDFPEYYEEWKKKNETIKS